MLTMLNRYGLPKLLAYSTGLVDQELQRNQCLELEDLILSIGKPGDAGRCLAAALIHSQCLAYAVLDCVHLTPLPEIAE